MTELGKEQAGDLRRYLTVVVSGELFAIDIARIREVLHCPRMTRMPRTSPAVPGVINLRGAVVPVLDLAVRIGRRVTPIERRTCIVVVEVMMDDRLSAIGLLVDAVEEAIEAGADTLEALPAFGCNIPQAFLAAMLRVDARFVSVLELANVANPEQLEAMVRHHTRPRGKDTERLTS
jgi:purine-binding chemotaxis protein CheW